MVDSYDDLKRFHPKTFMTLDGHAQVKGYDYDSPFDFSAFLDAYATTGFQATNISRAIDVIRMMRREKATIILSFTSNMVSSGLREAITYLVKHKLVDVLITTAGGIEEDIIKCLKSFVIGDFEISGTYLFEHGVFRTGNILIPQDRYTVFEQFVTPILNSLSTQGTISSCQLAHALGSAINNEQSYLYWAAKHDIPVFCPAPTDGSIGDMLYFAAQRNPSFKVDVLDDMRRLIGIVLHSELSGGIILGSGLAKHYTLNANIFKEGFDYLVVVSTAQEYDGSDSGARLDEAISWAKIKPNAPRVKVHADATIVFPLIMIGGFNMHISEKKA